MANTSKIQRVLIADDEPQLRQILADMLAPYHFQIFQANNGREAQKTFQAEPIDLLITDFRMPEMNGVELLQWCRGQGIHIPVILISGEADLIPVEQIALSDCCATLMFKPLRLEVIRAAIGAAQSRSHHQDCVHHRKAPI